MSRCKCVNLKCKLDIRSETDLCKVSPIPFIIVWYKMYFGRGVTGCMLCQNTINHVDFCLWKINVDILLKFGGSGGRETEVV